MKFLRKILENSGVLYLPLDKDLALYLELEKGTTVEIQDEEGKKGKYASFYKKQEEKQQA